MLSSSLYASRDLLNIGVGFLIILLIFISLMFCFCLFHLKEDENKIKSLQLGLEKGFRHQITPPVCNISTINENQSILTSNYDISCINKAFNSNNDSFQGLIKSENLLKLNEWNESDSYLFHYTDKHSAKLILASNLIQQGKSVRSTFGRGVFFTMIQPTERDKYLLKNNYRDKSKFRTKIECAFAFKLADLRAKKIDDPFYKNRDLWRFDNNIKLSDYNFKLILRK